MGSGKGSQKRVNASVKTNNTIHGACDGGELRYDTLAWSKYTEDHKLDGFTFAEYYLEQKEKSNYTEEETSYVLTEILGDIINNGIFTIYKEDESPIKMMDQNKKRVKEFKNKIDSSNLRIEFSRDLVARYDDTGYTYTMSEDKRILHLYYFDGAEEKLILKQRTKLNLSKEINKKIGGYNGVWVPLLVGELLDKATRIKFI